MLANAVDYIQPLRLRKHGVATSTHHSTVVVLTGEVQQDLQDRRTRESGTHPRVHRRDQDTIRVAGEAAAEKDAISQRY